jgi:hypothetical protein
LVAAYFPEEPPRFFHLPFSVFGETTLTALAKEGGFPECRVSLLTKDGESASAADAAAGMLLGSPIYPQIMARDPAMLPLIREGLTNGLARAFGKSPLLSRMQAWFVEATT